MKKRLANPGLWAALIAVVAAASLGGCYHRVVRAEGIGNANYTIHEANLKDDGGRVGSTSQVEPMTRAKCRK